DPASGASLSVPVKSGSTPVQHLEIEIAWSERKHDRWTGKQTGKGALLVRSDIVKSLTSAFNTDTDGVAHSALFFVADPTASPPGIICGYEDTGKETFQFLGKAAWAPCAGTVTWIDYRTPTATTPEAVRSDLPNSLALSDNQPQWRGGATGIQVTIDR